MAAASALVVPHKKTSIAANLCSGQVWILICDSARRHIALTPAPPSNSCDAVEMTRAPAALPASDNMLSSAAPSFKLCSVMISKRMWVPSGANRSAVSLGALDWLMVEKNCPNCGDRVPELRPGASVIDCPSCHTTLILDRNQLLQAGHSGVLAEGPSIFEIGQKYRAKNLSFEILGRVQYKYGRGAWDEYWAESSKGSLWLSVDEGDIALQWPRAGISGFARKRGSQWEATQTRVTYEQNLYIKAEDDHATAIAFRGMLDAPVALGDTHRFINFQGPRFMIASLELWDGGAALFIGSWLDPYEVEHSA